MKKQIAAAAAAAIIALTVPLASCGGEKAETAQTDAETSGTEVSQTGTEAAETRAPLSDYLPEMDLGGGDFVVLCRDDSMYQWAPVDITAAELNGEVINDAVYNRDLLVESQYDCTIRAANAPDVVSAAKKAVTAGDAAYSAVQTTYGGGAALSTAGCICDLSEYPVINIQSEWWDTLTIGSTEIYGRYYMVSGDINTVDNEATWAVFLNKSLAADFGLGDHYQIINDGKYTIDLLYQNSLKVTGDLDGSGDLTPEDRWGTAGNLQSIDSLYISSGGRTVRVQDDGSLTLCMADENMVSLLGGIYDYVMDDTATLRANDWSGKYSDFWESANYAVFREGRALYCIQPIMMLSLIRDMENDFSILPLPKSGEEQEQYYNFFQFGNATAYMILLSAADTGCSAQMIEALAYESDGLTQAYYEITLKRKYTRDDQSAAMLDIIFSTRIVDLGLLYDWGGLTSFYVNKLTKSRGADFASSYAKTESSITRAMEKTLDAYRGN